MPKTNHPRHGGAKPLFTTHVRDGLIDLRVLRADVERAEQMAEAPGTRAGLRQVWTRYRDLVEAAIDVRIDLIVADVDSHERAIDEAGCPALCRAGVQTDPTRGELRELARLQIEPTLTGARA